MLALRERNFLLYWLGQAISNTGNWMQIVALGWFVLQISDAPIALGLLGLVQSVPVFTLSLVGGMLADRFSRLKLLLVTQSAAMLLAVLLALLAALGRPPLWSMLLGAGLVAVVIAIDNPTRQAFLSDLVSKEALLNAVALNASVYNGAAVIGPSLAGLLLLRIGAVGCFLLNAVSFLAVLVALLVIAIGRVRRGREMLESPIPSPTGATQGSTPHHPSTPAPTERPRFPGDLPKKPTRKMTQGSTPHIITAPAPTVSKSRQAVGLGSFGLLRHEYTIMAVLGIAAVTSLLGRPYLLLMPAFAHGVQDVGPTGLGLMVAASGLGSLAGSVVLAALKSSRRLERLLVLCGVGFGLALVVFALSRPFLIAVLVLIACGAGATMTMTVANTLLQTRAPTEIRGRVMSLYTLIAAGLTPLGSLLVTGLGSWIGLSSATMLAGLGVAGAVIVGYRVLLMKDNRQ